METKLASEDNRKPFPINKNMDAFLTMQPDSIVVNIESKGQNMVTKHFTDVTHAYSYIESLRELFGDKDDGRNR